MRVELLVVPDCPNEHAALAVLRAAAEAAGLELAVTITVIDSAEHAHQRGFIGSPTFLIDGRDPFPIPGAPTGLTCRIYATADGMRGVPEHDLLRDALVTA